MLHALEPQHQRFAAVDHDGILPIELLEIGIATATGTRRLRLQRSRLLDLPSRILLGAFRMIAAVIADLVVGIQQDLLDLLVRLPAPHELIDHPPQRGRAVATEVLRISGLALPAPDDVLEHELPLPSRALLLLLLLLLL